MHPLSLLHPSSRTSTSSSASSSARSTPSGLLHHFSPRDQRQPSSFHVHVRLSTPETIQRLGRSRRHIAGSLLSTVKLMDDETSTSLQETLEEVLDTLWGADDELLCCWLNGEERGYLAAAVLAVEAMEKALMDMIKERSSDLLDTKAALACGGMEHAMDELEEMRSRLAREIVGMGNQDHVDGYGGDKRHKRGALARFKDAVKEIGSGGHRFGRKQSWGNRHMPTVSVAAKQREFLDSWKEVDFGTRPGIMYI